MRYGFAFGGGPYHFLIEARAMPRLRASGLRAASSAWRSRLPRPSGAWRQIRQSRHTWPSSYTASPRRSRVTGKIARLRPHIVLTQNRDDLLFRKPLSLHQSVLQSRPDSNLSWRKLPVAGQSLSISVVLRYSVTNPRAKAHHSFLESRFVFAA